MDMRDRIKAYREEEARLMVAFKQEEIRICAEVAEELAFKYEGVDNVPAWAVKEALMQKFGFMKGTHEQVVSELTDDVFTMMHEDAKILK